MVCWAIAGALGPEPFYLAPRGARAARPTAGGAAVSEPPAGPAGDPAREPEPYPGLFRPRFFVATARAAAMTLLLGVLIFLIMPRTDSRAAPSPAGPRGPGA